MDKEKWKDIRGYKRLYQVSNLGKIKSLKRNTTKGKILKGTIENVGYKVVGLSKNGKEHNFRIHRLVANAFIPNLNNLYTINHIDLDKTNNKTSNLEWLSLADNIRYSVKKQGNTRGEKSHWHKLNKEQVFAIRKMRKENPKITYKKIGYLFNISLSHICSICLNKYWNFI